MSILAWLAVGLIAGFLASKVAHKTGAGLLVDIGLGAVGAIVGGFVFHALRHSAAADLNLYSLLVAFVGAVILLALYHMIFRSRAL